MDQKWEIWGVIGVIAIQTTMVWLLLRMATEVAGIYLSGYPSSGF